MISSQSPSLKETGPDALKSKLDDFIKRNSINKFEGEDIVELIGDGEEIGWIISQLKGDNPDLDIDEITPLLAEIRALAGPVKAIPDPAAIEAAPDDESAGEQESGVFPAPPGDDSVMPDQSRTDSSEPDLERFLDALPADIKLPPGFDMKQLKNLLQSPRGKAMSDFMLFCHEKGMNINEDALDDPRVLKLQEEWESTPRDAFDGKTPSEILGDDYGGMIPEKVKPFRRDDPRIGRNDPCPCGSGRKYKKCCGRV